MRNNQTFNVIDVRSMARMKSELRSVVHRDGAWHQAVNAYVIRPNNSGKFDILTQTRSNYVDIAQNKIDQSLATQLLVEDDGNLERAIRRGLRDELNIISSDIVTLAQFNLDNSIKVSKKYEYNSDLWNRELITSYVVTLSPNVDIKLCPKVAAVDWVDWDEFKNIVTINPKLATKTSRLFVLNNQINKEFEEFAKAILKGIVTKMYQKEYFLFSDVGNDVTYDIADGSINVSKYNTNQTITMVSSEMVAMGSEEIYNIIENKMEK